MSFTLLCPELYRIPYSEEENLFLLTHESINHDIENLMKFMSKVNDEKYGRWLLKGQREKVR